MRGHHAYMYNDIWATVLGEESHAMPDEVGNRLSRDELRGMRHISLLIIRGVKYMP